MTFIVWTIGDLIEHEKEESRVDMGTPLRLWDVTRALNSCGKGGTLRGTTVRSNVHSSLLRSMDIRYYLLDEIISSFRAISRLVER